MAPRVIFLALLVLAVSPHLASPQVTIIDGDKPWIRCSTCWKGYDSTFSSFRIGAVDFKYPDSAAAWGLDFTTLYGLPDLPALARIIDTPGVDHLCDHPFIRYLDTLTSRLWKRADSAGFRSSPRWRRSTPSSRRHGGRSGIPAGREGFSF